MANSQDTDEQDLQNLSSIFKEGLDLYNKINNTTEPVNSLSVQVSFLPPHSKNSIKPL